MDKYNCWKFKKCGREPGGENTKEFGICPAATETKINGTHGGKNAGRCCWIIAGTFCDGKIQSTFSVKFKTCIECDFFKMVTREEDKCLTASEINTKIRKKNNTDSSDQTS